MDIYGLAAVHLKDPNCDLGYTDALFFCAEPKAMVRNWLGGLKRIVLKWQLPRSVWDMRLGGLAQAHRSH